MTYLNKRHRLIGLDDFSEDENALFWRRRAAGKISLHILGLSTTSACNYKCNYCYGFDTKPQRSKLSLDEQNALIDQAVDLGARTVLICGDGEPTVDPDLLGIIAHAHKSGLRSVVVSNGNILGNEEAALRVFGRSCADLVQFFYEHAVSFVLKLDTLDEANYEKTVGRVGTYRQVMNGLNRLVDSGFGASRGHDKDTRLTRVALSGVICKQNFNEVPRLREYAEDMGAQFICKFPSFIGNAVKNRALFFPPTESTTLWLRENYIRMYSEKPETLTTDSIHCGVWSYGAVVGETGDIRLCYSAACPPSKPIGNVRDESLAALLARRERVYADLLTQGEPCHIKRAQYLEVSEDYTNSRSLIYQT